MLSGLIIIPTGTVFLALSGEVYEVAFVRLFCISTLVVEAEDKLFHKILNDINHDIVPTVARPTR